MKDKSTHYYQIEKAIRFMEANFRTHPSLDAVAAHVELSPFHFQRLFVDWVGLTPKKFLQYLTVSYLKSRIGESRNVMDAADIAGLSVQSRVYDLFVNIEGMTPQQFKRAGAGMRISYGYHATPFGLCFIAVAERGICELHFLDATQQGYEYGAFAQRWCFATLVYQPELTETYVQRLFKAAPQQDRFQLLVQGTSFQIKVWQALRNIPLGEVRSYAQLAQDLNCPESIRAVASAAGRNPISYLVPCHRVITQEGQVGQFHLGKTRKRLMLAWELAATAQPVPAST